MTKSAMPPLSPDQAVFVTSDLTRFTVQPLLLALMTTAQCAGFVALFEIHLSDQFGLSLTAATFAMSLAGVYGTIWLTNRGGYIYNPIAHRSGELFILVIFIRLGTWTVSGTWPDLSRLGDFAHDPLSFFDLPFVLISTIAVYAWARGMTLGSLFCKLAIEETEVREFANADPAKISVLARTRTRSPILTDYLQTWLIGGAILLLCCGISQLEVPESGDTWVQFRDASLRGDLVLALLAYTFIGAWLLSQGRLSAAHHRWMAVGIRPHDMTGRHWQRSCLALMLPVMLIAAFLPWDSSMADNNLVSLAKDGIYHVVILLNGLVIMVLKGIYMVFDVEFFDWGQSTAPIIPEIETAEPLPEASKNEAPDDGLLAGLLIWASIAVIGFFVIRSYLTNREFQFNLEGLRQFWHSLIRRLRALFHGAKGELEGAREFVQSILRSKPDRKATGTKRPKTSPWRFLRVNQLPPREQVRYFYLSALRHAGRRGIARQQHLTPHEYAKDVSARWPHVQEDFDVLTEAFLKARYSRSDIVETEASAARAMWKRLRTAFKRRA